MSLLNESTIVHHAPVFTVSEAVIPVSDLAFNESAGRRGQVVATKGNNPAGYVFSDDVMVSWDDDWPMSYKNADVGHA